MARARTESLAWSPDGTKLAITGVETEGPGAQHARLFTIGAGGGKLKPLSGEDRPRSRRSLDERPERPGVRPALRWTPDGKAIDALVADRGSTLVVRFDAKSGKATALTGRDRHVTAFAHSTAATAW